MAVEPNATTVERINDLLIKSANFWSTMSSELQVILNSVSPSNGIGGCKLADLARVKKLIGRSLEALRKVSTQNSSKVLISNVMESLNEALYLLREVTASGKLESDRMNARRSPKSPICSPQHPTTGSGEAVTVGGAATAPDMAGTSSSCSCSCRRRCSRMAASVQELTNILSSTTAVLTGRLERDGAEKANSH
ncbi:hypothetical protein Aperf_G00000058571 [Anoplocephala perfoliata]